MNWTIGLRCHAKPLLFRRVGYVGFIKLNVEYYDHYDKQRTKNDLN